MPGPAVDVPVVIAEARDRVGGRGAQFGRVQEVEGGGDRGLEVETLHRGVASLGPVGEEHGRHRSAVLVEFAVGFPLHAARRQSGHGGHDGAVLGPLRLAFVPLVVPAGPCAHIVLGRERAQENRAYEQDHRDERDHHPGARLAGAPHQPDHETTCDQNQQVGSGYPGEDRLEAEGCPSRPGEQTRCGLRITGGAPYVGTQNQSRQNESDTATDPPARYALG